MALYSDFNLSFERDPDTGDIPILTDERAVAQSIRNLILTSFYERPFKSSLGSTINNLLFEPLTTITETLLARSIKTVIDQFEPRAKVVFVDVYSGIDASGVSLSDNEIAVDVGFYVYNRPNLVTTKVILRRLR